MKALKRDGTHLHFIYTLNARISDHDLLMAHFCSMQFMNKVNRKPNTVHPQKIASHGALFYPHMTSLITDIRQIWSDNSRTQDQDKTSLVQTEYRHCLWGTMSQTAICDPWLFVHYWLSQLCFSWTFQNVERCCWGSGPQLSSLPSKLLGKISIAHIQCTSNYIAMVRNT